MPEDDAELAEWVFDRFVEKDERLVRHTEDGRFEGAEWPDRVRLADWFASERRPLRASG